MNEIYYFVYSVHLHHLLYVDININSICFTLGRKNDSEENTYFLMSSQFYSWAYGMDSLSTNQTRKLSPASQSMSHSTLTSAQPEHHVRSKAGFLAMS